MQVVYSDNSDTGYGEFTVENGCHIAQGRWSEDEAKRSSTWRDIRAVRLMLESLIPMLKNKHIQWFSDNQNVVRILQVGSKKEHSQQEALAVFSMSAKNLICIEPEWILRTETSKQIILACYRTMMIGELTQRLSMN